MVVDSPTKIKLLQWPGLTPRNQPHSTVNVNVEEERRALETDTGGITQRWSCHDQYRCVPGVSSASLSARE